MRVKHSALTPAGYAVHLDLANGWTFSMRQHWGNRLTVMAWPTGTDTSIKAHRFGGGRDFLDEVEDGEIPELIAEVARLGYPETVGS